MSDSLDTVSRAVTSSLASLLALGTTVAVGGDVQRSRSLVLVAYFSRSGNTRVVAGLIHRALGADLFEVRPAKPYPDDYLETVEQARQERDSGYAPALESKVSNIDDYDTVFLGFPIWGETTPPVIRAFLAAHDLSGKILVPFVTHGGYGLGNSQSILAEDAPKTRLRAGFSMEADQERKTMERVNSWLKQKQRTE